MAGYCFGSNCLFYPLPVVCLKGMGNPVIDACTKPGRRKLDLWDSSDRYESSWPQLQCMASGSRTIVTKRRKYVETPQTTGRKSTSVADVGILSSLLGIGSSENLGCNIIVFVEGFQFGQSVRSMPLAESGTASGKKAIALPYVPAVATRSRVSRRCRSSPARFSWYHLRMSSSLVNSTICVSSARVVKSWRV